MDGIEPPNTEILMVEGGPHHGTYVRILKAGPGGESIVLHDKKNGREHKYVRTDDRIIHETQLLQKGGS